MRFSKFLLLSAAVLIAFDTVASVASASLQFPYTYVWPGSVLVYVGLSFEAARRFGFWRGVLLGALLGFVDGTAGWAVSWAIGPGRVPAEHFSVGIWALTLAMVVGFGAVQGAFGSGICTLVHRSRAA